MSQRVDLIQTIASDRIVRLLRRGRRGMPSSLRLPNREIPTARPDGHPVSDGAGPPPTEGSFGGVVRRGRVDTPDRGGRSKTRDSSQKPKEEEGLTVAGQKIRIRLK